MALIHVWGAALDAAEIGYAAALAAANLSLTLRVRAADHAYRVAQIDTAAATAAWMAALADARCEYDAALADARCEYDAALAGARCEYDAALADARTTRARRRARMASREAR